MKETPEEAREHLKYERDKRSTPAGMERAAREGDKDCAMQMVRIAAAELENASGMDPEVKDYLRDCLIRIESGESPDRAFNFRQDGPGARYDFWKQTRDADLARGVAYHRQQGMTLEQACEHVAETYQGLNRKAGAVGVEAVRRAYKRFRPPMTGK